MNNELSVDVIEAKYDPAYGGHRRIVVICPLCQQRHEHGARIGERGVIGRRVPGCRSDAAVLYFVHDDSALADFERAWMAMRLEPVYR